MSSIEDYFDIGEKLGKGAFGSVYRATPNEHARKEIPNLPDGDVAIKSVEASSRTRTGLINEVRALRILRPPRYTQYYGCFQGYEWGPEGGPKRYVVDKKIYLVTSLIQGKDLKNILESETVLTNGQRTQILSQIAEAIISLHQAGIAHLDIKPGNIMVDLDPDINVTVIDFNMVCMLEKMQGNCLGSGGTPRFMDPRVKGDRESLKRADWWAFGKVAIDLYGSVGAIPEPYQELIMAMTDPELQQNERPDADTVATVFGATF